MVHVSVVQTRVFTTNLLLAAVPPYPFSFFFKLDGTGAGAAQQPIPMMVTLVVYDG